MYLAVATPREGHFTGSGTARDMMIGMSAGLTAEHLEAAARAMKSSEEWMS